MILRFVVYTSYVFFRVGLRLVYGKNRRDEYISVNRFTTYHRLKQMRYNLRWSSAKYGYDKWEPQVSEFLKSITGELFIDVGASVGYYTLLLASNFNEVIAIEPESNSVKRLVENTSHLENVSVLQEAVSNEDGEISFYISPTIGWHTLTPNKGDMYEMIKVKTRTLTSILGSRVASLVKVDTEGAELKILMGTSPEQVSSWLIEAHGGVERRVELEKLLREMGYEKRWITNSHIYACRGDFR